MKIKGFIFLIFFHVPTYAVTIYPSGVAFELLGEVSEEEILDITQEIEDTNLSRFFPMLAHGAKHEPPLSFEVTTLDEEENVFGYYAYLNNRVFIKRKKIWGGLLLGPIKHELIHALDDFAIRDRKNIFGKKYLYAFSSQPNQVSKSYLAILKKCDVKKDQNGDVDVWNVCLQTHLVLGDYSQMKNEREFFVAIAEYVLDPNPYSDEKLKNLSPLLIQEIKQFFK